jgi:hypothetical protein
VIHVDAALGEELFQTPVGQEERGHQRTAKRIASAGNRNPANAEGACWGCLVQMAIHPATVTGPGRSSKQHSLLDTGRRDAGIWIPYGFDGGC